MSNIKVKFNYTGISTENILSYKEKVERIDRKLREKKDDPKEFLGWFWGLVKGQMH